MPFDFESAVTAPFRMQPGLRRLAPGAAPLTPNRPGAAALDAKLAVLRDHAAEALVAVPGFDAAPALRTLMRQAAADCPGTFTFDGDAGFDARALGWSVLGDTICGDGPRDVGAVLRALPPAWRATGLMCLALAEDVAVIDAASGRIPWLAVCLPSHWAPRDKVGRHFAEVHAPVADNQLLLGAADHLARLVCGPDRWERFVWSIGHDGRLDRHPRRPVAPWPAGLDGDALAAQAWFRTEHQTFVPVDGGAQALFTIHVDSRPLASAVASAAEARRLHDALASMSAAVLDYRGLAPARDRLVAWLAARAA